MNYNDPKRKEKRATTKVLYGCRRLLINEEKQNETTFYAEQSILLTELVNGFDDKISNGSSIQNNSD